MSLHLTKDKVENVDNSRKVRAESMSDLNLDWIDQNSPSNVSAIWSIPKSSCGRFSNFLTLGGTCLHNQTFLSLIL